MKKTRFQIPDRPPGRPKVSEVLPLLNRFLALPGNEVGGNLHIITEDGNIGDGHIAYCLEACADDPLGADLCRKMLQMTRTQRRKLIAMRA